MSIIPDIIPDEKKPLFDGDEYDEDDFDDSDDDIPAEDEE